MRGGCRTISTPPAARPAPSAEGCIAGAWIATARRKRKARRSTAVDTAGAIVGRWPLPEQRETPWKRSSDQERDEVPRRAGSFQLAAGQPARRLGEQDVMNKIGNDARDGQHPRGHDDGKRDERAD